MPIDGIFPSPVTTFGGNVDGMFEIGVPEVESGRFDPAGISRPVNGSKLGETFDILVKRCKWR